MSDCNASMGRTGDTEIEVTRRQTPNAPLITPWASHHHPQATGSPCIQALKLRNATRVPAWSAFICSPEPAEGRGTAGMAAEGWLAGLRTQPESEHTGSATAIKPASLCTSAPAPGLSWFWWMADTLRHTPLLPHHLHDIYTQIRSWSSAHWWFIFYSDAAGECELRHGVAVCPQDADFPPQTAKSLSDKELPTAENLISWWKHEGSKTV